MSILRSKKRGFAFPLSQKEAIFLSLKLIKAYSSKVFVFLSTFVLYFFLFQQQGIATTYYVDQTEGLDSNLGTTTGQAWKTISKVNSSSFNPGDNIYFKRGEIWREQLTVPSSGSSGSPITFGAYGEGEKPKIYASTQVSNWTDADIAGSTGNLMSEGFEATKPTNAGYDNAGWTETIGSGIFDTDNTDVARPTNGGNHVLKIQKSSSDYNVISSKNLAANNPIVYARIYFQYNTYSLANGEMVSIAEMRDSDDKLAWRLYFKYLDTSPNTRINLRYYNNGSDNNWSTDSTTNIVANNWYKLEVKYDVTNKTYEWKIDGITKGSGDLTGTLPLGGKNFRVGDRYIAKTATYYLDSFDVDSSGYPTDSTVLPDNVWRADLAAAPKQIWLNKSSATYWGNPETSLSNLNAEFDWYANSGKLFVYSTTDPDSTYDWIEATQRDTGVTASRDSTKQYITIDNLDIKFAAKHGIQTGSLSPNWTITNNDVAYISLQHDAYADGIYVNGSNSTVSGNTIHDAGDHGIYVLSNYASGTVENVTVENNTVYDCYHTGIDVMNLAGTLQNITVRNNKYYNTTSYNTVWTNRAILVSTGAGYIVNGVNIYNNLIYNICDTGIQIGGTPGNEQNISIYNNTVFDKLSSCSVGTWAYLIKNTMNAGTNNFKNNIGALTLGTTGSNVINAEDSSKLSTFDNNLYYRIGGAGTYVATINGSNYTTQSAYRSALNPKEASSLFADPIFVNSANLNFNLQSTSPAINTGANLSSIFTSDLIGTPRPQGSAFDMGAYEYSPVTVTINQADSQDDPTSSSPINFTVIFSESVTGFETGDVTLSGTAEPSTAIITGSGSTYNVAVSGMTGDGTVIASISANKVIGTTSNNPNDASTSTDNSVNYDTSAPTLTSISISDDSGFTDTATPTITIVSSASPTAVAFSCNGGTNWSNWIEYADSISSFNFTSGATGCNASDGSKTITAKLKNALNVESETASDTTYFDTTAPTDGSISYSDGYYTTTTVNLTLADGTDGDGSGINTASRVVQRKAASLTDGTCGSYGSFTQITPTGSYPNLTDTSVSSGYCYQYRYLVADNLENLATYTSENVVKVDTSAPTNPGAPTTTSSANDSTPTWSWTSSVDLHSGLADIPYTVEWAKNSEFSLETGSSNAITNSFTHTEELSDGTWYFRVKAADLVGHSSDWSVVGSFVLDSSTSTPEGSIYINNGNHYTKSSSVTLTISASDEVYDSSQLDMKVSNSSNLLDASYENFSNTKNWELTSPTIDGNKTVYIKFKNPSGNESIIYSSNIIYDSTPPLDFNLENPSENAYTNSERSSFRWNVPNNADVTSGLSHFTLEIDNGDTGDFSIGNILSSSNGEIKNNKYVVYYENFSDQDNKNNNISVYTKSSSEWQSISENNGELKEGKRTWKIIAHDHAGNQRTKSRTLFVDKTGPETSVKSINTIAFNEAKTFTTEIRKPSFSIKITDYLSGDKQSNQIASGPKSMEVRIERKNVSGKYDEYSSETFSLEKMKWSNDNQSITDNSLNVADKYVDFEYIPKNNLSPGNYRIIFTSIDRANNTGRQYSFNLVIKATSTTSSNQVEELVPQNTKEALPEIEFKEKETVVQPITKSDHPSSTNIDHNIFYTIKQVITNTFSFLKKHVINFIGFFSFFNK